MLLSLLGVPYLREAKAMTDSSTVSLNYQVFGSGLSFRLLVKRDPFLSISQSLLVSVSSSSTRPYAENVNSIMGQQMSTIGYARVSTDEQNLSLQIDALKAVGCEKIFSDQGISGSLASRPNLNRALRTLRAGDKLVVWRLDRLGRSLVNLIQLLDQLGEKGVRFHSLNENIDTTSSGGRLVFHMMAALAEFERTLISERTRAGMAAARAKGKHVGRPPSLTHEQCLDAMRLIKYENHSLKAVAERYNVTTHTTPPDQS